MNTRTLTVGRSPDSDVRIHDETVSRRHAELTVTKTGRYYLTDCGSLRGTSVFRGGEWTPLRQGYVDPNERIRIGEFETRLVRLLEDNAYGIKAHQPRAANSVRLQQNVESGEVEGGSVDAK